MKTVDKFIAKNKPIDSSRLSNIKEDILKLMEHGFKAKQIHEYIVFHRKIDVSQRRVYQYIQMLKNRNDVEKKEVSKPQKPATTTSKKVEKKADTKEEAEKQRKAEFEQFLKKQDEAGFKPGVTEYKPKFESSWLKDE